MKLWLMWLTVALQGNLRLADTTPFSTRASVHHFILHLPSDSS
jgi:hypothetical protein